MTGKFDSAAEWAVLDKNAFGLFRTQIWVEWAVDLA